MIFTFDGDAAGRKAALRAFNEISDLSPRHLWRSNRMVSTPANCDCRAVLRQSATHRAAGAVVRVRYPGDA